MVFYRKYRPQTVEELDSKEVREKLNNVLKSPDVPHAFLFTGPKGLGKTSTARIIAKSLNCKKKRKGIEPCNECEQCESITNGTNMDVLEIDGASNRGIDEIRDLREKIKLAPMGANKKVYIIDEVHMLTTEAFNALLKTLEEPPNHVVFILCTTEPHKVPSTILSRCLRIKFKKATNEELVRSFERIMKKEGLKAEKEVLLLIAGFSDGSFRDGVKVLEEMASIAKDKKITKELIEKNYSVASVQYQIARMIKFLEDKDIKSAFGIVAKLTDEGIEMGYFIEKMIETLHSSLLLKAGLERASSSGLVLDNLKLEIPEIKGLIELLSKARSELRYAVLPQLPLELAIVEWEIQQRKTDAAHPVDASLEADEDTNLANENKASLSTKMVYANDQKGSTKSQPREESRPLIVSQQDISKYNKNDAFWTALIDNVKAHNHSVAGVLRGCSIKNYDDKLLLLETNFKFHKDRLSEQKTKVLLNKACREVTRKDVKIEIVLKGGDRKNV